MGGEKWDTIRFFNLLKKKNLIFKIKAIFRQFDDEVLDCTFSLNGKLVAGCSADGAAKVFSVTTKSELGDLEGHDDAEVSRVQFR